MTRAKQKAMAGNLRAQPLAQVMQSARALCGWMRRRCRHVAQCVQAEPSEVVLRASQPHERARPAPSPALSFDIQEMCRRMEHAAKDEKHRLAAEKFERLKVERIARESEQCERRRAANDQERMDSARERQRREWDRNWGQGLRPVAASPGRPLDRQSYEMLLGGRPYAPPFEMVVGFGEGAIRSAMDAWSMPNAPRQQQLRMFLNIARRIQRGFGVSWMTQIDIEKNGLTPLEWDDKRGPFYSQGGDCENDLPVEMYDGGDSSMWTKKQREAEAFMRGKVAERDGKTKKTIDQLLGTVGRKIDY